MLNLEAFTYCISLFCFYILISFATGKPCFKNEGTNTQVGGDCTPIRDATKAEIVAALTSSRVAALTSSSLETDSDVDPSFNATWWKLVSRKRSRKQCAHPITPAHGIMNGTTTNIGDEYHFSCRTGFRLVGSQTITCNDHIGPYAIWTDYYPYCVTTITPSDSVLPLSADCNFEANLCGFIQDDTDDFDWIRFTGSTKTRLTGPSYDHTYKDKYPGHYMYAESSHPRVANEKARLYSLRYPASSRGYCLVFWYHMYGENVGSLNVYIKRDTLSAHAPELHLEGNLGNQWKMATHTIDGHSKGFRIIFESIIGTGFRGDIAIDDLSISAGPCGAPPVG